MGKMPMTNRRKSFLLANALSALAAGAIAGTAMAADLKLRPQVRSADTSDYDQTSPAAKSQIITAKKTGASSRDVTGTIEWPASARGSLTRATAAISHTYSARASFAKARAAMESGILLREDVPKPNFTSLESATEDVLSELKALDLVTQHRSDEAIKRATTLVQDWYETGL